MKVRRANKFMCHVQFMGNTVCVKPANNLVRLMFVVVKHIEGRCHSRERYGQRLS